MVRYFAAAAFALATVTACGQRDVFGQKAGVAGVLVVRVERVGHAAKAAEPLQADDLAGELGRLGGLDLFLRGAVVLQFGDLAPEGGFQIFELDAGLGGDVAVDDAGELLGIDAAGDALRDLRLVDERLVEAAGLGSAQREDRDLGVFGLRRANWRREPGDGEPRQLDRVGNGGAPLRGDGRRRRVDWLDLRARAEWGRSICRAAPSASLGSKSPAMAMDALLGV